MALTLSTVEQLVEWCAKSEDIADVRAKARADFFGYGEPGAISYIDDTGEIISRERRFLGWFAFSFELPDGQHPGELAARALLKGNELSSALNSIRKARYVTAVVTSVIPGRGFYLELEDEEFEVSSPMLSHILQKESTLSTHILPGSHGQWLPGPGWLAWPIRFGPGIRSRLKKLQSSPIEVERFLQQRVKGEEELHKVDRPQDAPLKAAVARMTEAAKREGKPKLIMTPEEWKGVVLSYMMNKDSNGFAKEIFKRTGGFKSGDEANRWLALASNIWNTTPQPDRGGKSAYQLCHQEGTMGGDEPVKYMDYKIARLIARLRGEALDRLEQSWRRDIESKSLPVNTTLQAALNKLPAVWIDGICLCLGVPADRQKRDKVRRIVSHLKDKASLVKTIAGLQSQHREAIAYLLNCGGWAKYGELSRKFGNESGDGWWWSENPPQSIIGQLRLRGLLFIGQTPIGSRHYKTAIIPAEIRQSLQKALDYTSMKAKLPSRVANARSYQTLANQLSELKLRYGTFTTEDESLRAYYEQFTSYWNRTEYAKYKDTEGFGVEEYLWNFRLPGSDKFLLDCFLEGKGSDIPERLLPGLLNWRGAELKCCRIVSAKDLLLLEDLDNEQRMWCFGLSISGTKDFRGSLGKMVISYICPWDKDTHCLLGYSLIVPERKSSLKTYQDLKYALRNTTARTRVYFARTPRRPRAGLPEIPKSFLKAFEEE